jgi:hypothetical protein
MVRLTHYRRIFRIIRAPSALCTTIRSLDECQRWQSYFRPAYNRSVRNESWWQQVSPRAMSLSAYSGMMHFSIMARIEGSHHQGRRYGWIPESVNKHITRPQHKDSLFLISKWPELSHCLHPDPEFQSLMAHRIPLYVRIPCGASPMRVMPWLIANEPPTSEHLKILEMPPSGEHATG